MSSIARFSDLAGKAILVTGALRGIGRAISCELASQGAHIIFNGFRKDEERERLFIEEIERLGGKATPCMFDLGNCSEIQSAVEQLLKSGLQISGLVNNAGISKDQLMLRMKESDLSQVIDVNLKGAIFLTSLLSRHFLKVEQSVSIVNMSSVVGLMGNASQVTYAASKAGLIGFTKAVAKELAGRSIRCNAICPGFIETDMTGALNEKVKEQYLQSVPLKRFGKVEDVANLVSFLLSDASSYMTGEVIKVDGGLYI